MYAPLPRNTPWETSDAMALTNAPADPAPAMVGPLLETLLAEHRRDRLPQLRRLWQYYRNRRQNDPARPGSLAQEQGLPKRLGRGVNGQPLREIVIENDIAWRVHTMVDFMFGRPIEVQSLGDDPELRQKINTLLAAVFHASGGVSFFQDLALLGSVYGSVDILVRCDPDPADPAGGFTLELIEAPRAVPLVNPGDYRRLDGYAVWSHQTTHQLTRSGWLDRALGKAGPTKRQTLEHIECWTHGSHEVLRRPMTRSATNAAPHRFREELSVNRLGCVPVVHIQNLPQPFHYDGLSDVEPLIPLQDELNTRLSDRANRVTLASFKMYLAKGIEGFIDRPIGPGQMWATDNPDAAIDSFGGDTATPSEDAHITEVREAMDKTSGVSPVAAGVLRGKVGNLSSENAIRVVLLGLLARTEKKRITYGAGLLRCCEMILHAADVHGLLPNRPDQRRVRIDWPDPFPQSQTQQLENAERKLRLGVSQTQVLTELGYADCLPRHEDDAGTDTNADSDAEQNGHA